MRDMSEKNWLRMFLSDVTFSLRNTGAGMKKHIHRSAVRRAEHAPARHQGARAGAEPGRYTIEVVDPQPRLLSETDGGRYSV